MEMVSSSHNGTDAQINSQTVPDYKNLSQVQATWGSNFDYGIWTWVPISNKEGICNLYIPERENLFSIVE